MNLCVCVRVCDCIYVFATVDLSVSLGRGGQWAKDRWQQAVTAQMAADKAKVTRQTEGARTRLRDAEKEVWLGVVGVRALVRTACMIYTVACAVCSGGVQHAMLWCCAVSRLFLLALM